MVMHSPQSERVTLTLLLLSAWLGVILQLWLSLRFAWRGGQTSMSGLVAYLGYFTVLTNLFVALVGTARLAGRRSSLLLEHLRGCATTAILLVGIAYHFLLRNVWSPEGWQWVADLTLHYLVPLISLAYWMLFPPRRPLSHFAPVIWGIYPLVYFCYALVRGELIGSYPYYFVDASHLGYATVIVNALGLLTCFVVLGFVVRYLTRFRMTDNSAPANAVD